MVSKTIRELTTTGEETSSFVVLNKCRACNSTHLVPVLSLGETPLANSLVRPDELDMPEARFPLDLCLCEECGLTQIMASVSPARLFREYLYFSSYSNPVVQNAAGITHRLMATRGLNKDSLVVELASNDGYLLKNYAERGIPVLGIEPATNIARVAESRGIPTVSEFFGRTLAQQMVSRGKSADVIHANNVLAHVPDLNGFVAGLQMILKPAGIAVIEVPYVKEMVQKCEFDTIYHEHLCYFSLTALVNLFRNHSLAVVDVEQIPIHGGSIRLFVSHACAAEPSPNVHQMLDEERKLEIDRFAFYREFACTAARLKEKLRTVLYGLRADGRRIAAFGAAAKGATLLNYCGIGADVIDYVVDENPHKVGLFMPGVRIPISPTERLSQDRPDFVLLLAWNYADTILERYSSYRTQGVRFLVPVPDVEFH